MTQKVRVTVDVHCTEKAEDTGRYRLFVDQELVAERNFIWDHTSKYIREQMVLNLNPGAHDIFVESVLGQFHADNLIVDNNPANSLCINVVNNNS